MNTQRPPAVTVATVLLAFFSVLGVITAFIPAFSEGVPAVVVYSSFVLNFVGLAAAYGLWMLKKWGVWVAIILSLLNGLSAAPGMFFAPTVTLQVLAIVGVAVSALIIVLVVLPVSRRAYA